MLFLIILAVLGVGTTGIAIDNLEDENDVDGDALVYGLSQSELRDQVEARFQNDSKPVVLIVRLAEGGTETYAVPTKEELESMDRRRAALGAGEAPPPTTTVAVARNPFDEMLRSLGIPPTGDAPIDRAGSSSKLALALFAEAEEFNARASEAEKVAAEAAAAEVECAITMSATPESPDASGAGAAEETAAPSPAAGTAATIEGAGAATTTTTTTTITVHNETNFATGLEELACDFQAWADGVLCLGGTSRGSAASPGLRHRLSPGAERGDESAAAGGGSSHAHVPPVTTDAAGRAAAAALAADDTKKKKVDIEEQLAISPAAEARFAAENAAAKAAFRSQRLAAAAEAAARRDCLLCCDAPSDAVFLGCGHGGVCKSCAIDTFVRNREECPFCRAHVTQIVTIGSEVKCQPSGILTVEVTGPRANPIVAALSSIGITL